MKTKPITFFASGTNQSGEIRILGYVRGAHVGTVADRVDHEGTKAQRRSADELERFGFDTGRRVFIDSGAFTEVKFPEGVPTVVAPLTAAHWDRVFRVYEKAAFDHGPRAYVVAPDMVAHQAESLERLERYADRVRNLWELEARVLVPVQRGADLSMAEFWRRACDALELPGDELTAAIPMRNNATPLEELRAFLEDARPAAVHLLGIAPDTRRGKAAIALVREVLPGCELSADACLIRRMTGKTNGRGGGPRRYTEQTEAWAQAVEESEDLTADERTHLRKALALFHSLRTYWTAQGLDCAAVESLGGYERAIVEAVAADAAEGLDEEPAVAHLLALGIVRANSWRACGYELTPTTVAGGPNDQTYAPAWGGRELPLAVPGALEVLEDVLEAVKAETLEERHLDEIAHLLDDERREAVATAAAPCSAAFFAQTYADAFGEEELLDAAAQARTVPEMTAALVGLRDGRTLQAAKRARAHLRPALPPSFGRGGRRDALPG